LNDETVEITGCILAGGQGQRLGSVDKGLVRINSLTLVEYCLKRLAPQVNHVMISANRNQEIYRGFGAHVIADAPGEHAGPLAGFLAAMSSAKTPLVAMVACDCPFFPLDLVARLRVAQATAETEISVVRCGKRLQPVFAVVPVSLCSSLTSYLDAGERRISAWFARHRVREVEFDDFEAFANINTEAELERARERLS
jgi:molybdenum cofactor guanylyltransferase